MIIDRYIAKLFLAFFFAGLIVFVVVFLAVDFLGSYARLDAGLVLLGRYYLFMLPEIIYQMIPVACLLGTVFTLASLNKNSEITALFSLGLSLARVCAPILGMVAAVSISTFVLGDYWLPIASQKKNYVYYVEIRKTPSLYSMVRTNKIWYRSENMLFNLQTFNPERSVAQGLSLYFFDKSWNLIQLIKAQSVEMKGEQWSLKNGAVTLFAEESSFPLIQTFNQKVITVSKDLENIQSTPHASEVMNLKELRRFIKRNRDAGLDTLRYEVDYYSKLSFAFAGLVMALMGIPFSMSRQRSGGGLMNAGICVVLAFLYWILFSSALTLGRHGGLPPLLAAWGPNIIVLVPFIYWLLRRHK